METKLKKKDRIESLQFIINYGYLKQFPPYMRLEKAELLEYCGQLPDREQQVIALYYCEGLLFKEIGALFERSLERIRQIRDKALRRLGNKIRADKAKENATTVVQIAQDIIDKGQVTHVKEVLGLFEQSSITLVGATWGKPLDLKVLYD